MRIVELTALTEPQVADILVLMHELDPEIAVAAEMVKRAVAAEGTRFFAAVEDAGSLTGSGTGTRFLDKREMIKAGHIIGCASLCIYDSPTGRKASIEDVVVSSSFRGQGIGKALMEHVIDFARIDIELIDIHLTSRPHRIAANELYQSLGFERRETNVYRMKVRRKNK